MNDPLENLRDIHLPADPGWWPPAIGWWILAIFLLLIMATSIFYVIHIYRKNAYRRQALHELNRIHVESLDDRAYVNAIAALLKRTAIQAEIPGAASQQGSEWQTLLEKHMPSEQASLLAVSRYKKQSSIEKNTLYEATKTWIKVHKTC